MRPQKMVSVSLSWRLEKVKTIMLCGYGVAINVYVPLLGEMVARCDHIVAPPPTSGRGLIRRCQT